MKSVLLQEPSRPRTSKWHSCRIALLAILLIGSVGGCDLSGDTAEANSTPQSLETVKALARSAAPCCDRRGR